MTKEELLKILQKRRKDAYEELDMVSWNEDDAASCFQAGMDYIIDFIADEIKI